MSTCSNHHDVHVSFGPLCKTGSRRIIQDAHQNLIHVLELGVQISQLRLFVIREADVADGPGAAPVLDHQGDEVGHRGEAAEGGEGNGDGVALDIIRRVGVEERVRRDDAANVAEADLPGDADGAPVVPAQVHVEPAHDDGHGAVRPHDDEEQRRVLEVQVVVHRDQDAEPGDAEAQRHDGEESPVPEHVGKGRDDQREDEGYGPRRNGAELGLDGVELVRLDDLRREEGVAVGLWWCQRIPSSVESCLLVCEKPTGTMRPKYMRPPSQTL